MTTLRLLPVAFLSAALGIWLYGLAMRELDELQAEVERLRWLLKPFADREEAARNGDEWDREAETRADYTCEVVEEVCRDTGKETFCGHPAVVRLNGFAACAGCLCYYHEHRFIDDLAPLEIK